MSVVQIPTKLMRNSPCPCGSGRKFKKCCGKEKHKMETQPLKNEFRDEVRDPYAGLPIEELAKRDQAVLLKELRFRKLVNSLNRETVKKVVEQAKSVRIELMGMPKSPYRETIIADLGKTIENNQNQLKAIAIPRSITITLLALEELVEETEEKEDVDKLIEQVNKRVAESEVEEETRAEPMPEPVDDEPDELSDDDDENPEEVI